MASHLKTIKKDVLQHLLDDVAVPLNSEQSCPSHVGYACLPYSKMKKVAISINTADSQACGWPISTWPHLVLPTALCNDSAASVAETLPL